MTLANVLKTCEGMTAKRHRPNRRWQRKTDLRLVIQQSNKSCYSCFMLKRIVLACFLPLAATSTFAETTRRTCDVRAVYTGPTLRDTLNPSVFPTREIDLSQTVDVGIADQLETRFHHLVGTRTSATLASVAVYSTKRGYWAADYARDGKANQTPYWWASVGKLVTGAIIQRQIRDGVLSINEPIAQWFPDYPNANLITIQDLLVHTGGVFSFNSDRKLNAQKGFKSVELLIDISANHGPDFCPGENWNYSNTGYVMLSRVAEQLSDKTFADLVQGEIAEPLGLTSMSVIQAVDTDDTVASRAGSAPPSVEEIASIYGAGAVRSNATDMLILLNSYLRGGVTSPDLRNDAFAKLYPMYGSTMYYGQGVMVTDVLDPDNKTIWIGHSGGSPNAKGLVIYDVERETFVAMVLNVEAPAEAVANALLKLLDQAD